MSTARPKLTASEFSLEMERLKKAAERRGNRLVLTGMAICASRITPTELQELGWKYAADADLMWRDA